MKRTTMKRHTATKKSTGVILLLLAVILTLPLEARRGVDELGDIIRKTKGLYSGTTPVQLRFEQSGSSGRMQGTLSYTSGDRYRLEIPKQTIISNGTKTWTWYPDKNRVVISKPAAGSGQLTPGQILTSFPGNYSTSLIKSSTVNGRAVWVVRCLPGSGEKIGDITGATLYIDKSTYRFQQIDVESPSIGTMTIRILSANYGAKLSDSYFSFVPPQGARVVDLTR